MSIQTLATPTLTPESHSPATPPANGMARNGHPQAIIYPDSDGNPMADNTKQFEVIVALHSGFAALYKDDANVFVAGDLLWYPVEGDNRTRAAPDVMIAFGRPKGDRGSYKQWVEANIAPQVVFEILSPGNRLTEMAKKFAFYQRHGVEEYYIYDPDSGDLSGWLRSDQTLEVIDEMQGWVSPRTQVRFSVEDGALVVYRPDGKPFETYLELLVRAEEERLRAEQEHQRAEQESQRAEQESQRAEQESQRAEQESQRAEQERIRAEQESQRAEQERIRAEQEHLRAERLAEKLRALGVEPE
ncbi:MAG: Uma2 family endonuclease [Caldilineaceae bacterium]